MTPPLMENALRGANAGRAVSVSSPTIDEDGFDNSSANPPGSLINSGSNSSDSSSVTRLAIVWVKSLSFSFWSAFFALLSFEKMELDKKKLVRHRPENERKELDR